MLYLVNDPKLEDALAPYRERLGEVRALQKRAKYDDRLMFELVVEEREILTMINATICDHLHVKRPGREKQK